MISPAFPGADLVEQGLCDLARREVTVESLLVSLSAPRLRDLGLSVVDPFDESEMRLYQLLAERFGDGAHSKYNALIRQIVSFYRAHA